MHDEKWINVHGMLKTGVHLMVNNTWHVAHRYCIKSKSEIQDHTLKRAWAAIDLAIDNWAKDAELKTFRQSNAYKTLHQARCMAFTIADNDTYKKLALHLVHAWEKVKDDDSYIKDTEDKKE